MSYVYDATSYKVSGGGSSSSSTGDAFGDLGTGDFLKMMIAELQNQDPLDPTSNADLLNQINQIRSISSSDKLATTLENVALGQSFATASSLIGKTIDGTTDSGHSVSGKVDRVMIENGAAKIYVGDMAVSWDNITGIS